MNNNSADKLQARSDPSEEIIRVRPTLGLSYCVTISQILQLKYIASSEDSFLVVQFLTLQNIFALLQKKKKDH